MEEHNVPRSLSPSLSAEDKQYFGASIRHREDGAEYYSAREVAEFLGYTKWGAFLTVLRRAMRSYWPKSDTFRHFQPIERLTPTARGLLHTIDDYHLTREAFLLVVASADSYLPMVAYGKNYIAETMLRRQKEQP